MLLVLSNLTQNLDLLAGQLELSRSLMPIFARD